MTNTPGRRQLNDLLDAKNGRTQSWLAGLLGVNQSTVSDWCRGECRPEDPYRKAMVQILGIPEDAWATAAERRRIAQALRRAESGAVPSPAKSRPRAVGSRRKAAGE